MECFAGLSLCPEPLGSQAPCQLSGAQIWRRGSHRENKELVAEERINIAGLAGHTAHQEPLGGEAGGTQVWQCLELMTPRGPQPQPWLLGCGLASSSLHPSAPLSASHFLVGGSLSGEQELKRKGSIDSALGSPPVPVMPCPVLWE